MFTVKPGPRKALSASLLAIALGGVVHTPVANAATLGDLKSTNMIRWNPEFSYPDNGNFEMNGASGYFYCADPSLAGPHTGYQAGQRYNGPVPMTRWTSDAGNKVSEANIQAASYLINKYGQTADNTKAAEVQTAVWTLLETKFDVMDSKNDAYTFSKNAGILTNSQNLVNEAKKFAGPYKMVVTDDQAGKTVTPGQKVTVTVYVASASGAKMPNVNITLAYPGSNAATQSLNTGANGQVTATFTADKEGSYKVTATSGKELSGLASVYLNDGSSLDKDNGSHQRMLTAGPDVSVAGEVAGPTVQKPAELNPGVTTQVSRQSAMPGMTITDTANATIVTTANGNPVLSTLSGALYSQAPGATTWTKVMDIPATPVTKSGPLSGVGSYTIPLDTPVGTKYSYTESLISTVDENRNGKADTGEQTATSTHNNNHDVAIQTSTVIIPTMVTQTSSQVVSVGGKLTDSITVANTAGTSGEITARLIGTAAPVNNSCSAITTEQWLKLMADGQVKELSTEKLPVKGDGVYTTAPVTVADAGCVTWVEAATFEGTTKTVTTEPGVNTETTLVVAPKVSTVAQATTTYVGAEMRDNVKVEGLSGQSGVITGSLYGPLAPKSDGTCSNDAADWAKAPVVSEIAPIKVTKDGVYQTNPTTIKVSGCYTYDEKFTPDDSKLTVVNTKRGETPETKLFTQPAITTVAKATTTYVGASMSDDVKVTGVSSDGGVVSGSLLGPVAPNSDNTCVNLDWTKAPVADSIKPMSVAKDGVYSTSPTTIKAAGCYTYVESFTPNGGKTPVVNTKPGESTETLLFKVKPSTPVKETPKTPVKEAPKTPSAPVRETPVPVTPVKTPVKPTVVKKAASAPVVHARVNSGEAGANFTDSNGVSEGALASFGALLGLGLIGRRARRSSN